MSQWCSRHQNTTKSQFLIRIRFNHTPAAPIMGAMFPLPRSAVLVSPWQWPRASWHVIGASWNLTEQHPPWD